MGGFSRLGLAGAALAGGAFGALTAYVVAYHSAIGFLWPSTFGLAATLALGALVSVLPMRRPTARQSKFTWAQIMAAAEEPVGT